MRFYRVFTGNYRVLRSPCWWVLEDYFLDCFYSFYSEVQSVVDYLNFTAI